MFPTISETRLTGFGGPTGSLMSFGSNHGTSNGMAGTTTRHILTEEEQHLYNHHIIENFVESVREMNDVVLIPSKLKDLDPAAPSGSNALVPLNDDLYSYYQMINVVKNDLFEPHSERNSLVSRNESRLFAPKRKISRREHREQNGTLGHSRNQSSSSLASMVAYQAQVSKDSAISSAGESEHDSLESVSSSRGSSPPSTPALVPLSSEQLIGQNAKQLTVQFIHHLHSLYTILEHFTSAADFITERYTHEVETLI